MKVLTDKAIFIAHAGAAKMTANGNYRIERSRYSAHRVTVINPEGRRYALALERIKYAGWCACPFSSENGICKHRIWAGEQIDRENMEVAAGEERATGRANAQAEAADAEERYWNR